MQTKETACRDFSRSPLSLNDDLDDYEATLSPFARFVRRTEWRIRRCELQAALAEARARVASSRAKTAREGRSRRPDRADPRQKRAPACVDVPGSKASTGAKVGKGKRDQNHTPGKR